MLSQLPNPEMVQKQADQLLGAIQGAIRHGERQPDGSLVIRLTLPRLDSEDTPKPTFQFLSESRTVQYGRRSVRLSPTLFSLMRCICKHGRISFEAVQDIVWNREVADTLIRKSCSNLTAKLLDAGILYVVITTRGHIALEEAVS